MLICNDDILCAFSVITTLQQMDHNYSTDMSTQLSCSQSESANNHYHIAFTCHTNRLAQQLFLNTRWAQISNHTTFRSYPIYGTSFDVMKCLPAFTQVHWGHFTHIRSFIRLIYQIYSDHLLVHRLFNPKTARGMHL